MWRFTVDPVGFVALLFLIGLYGYLAKSCIEETIETFKMTRFEKWPFKLDLILLFEILLTIIIVCVWTSLWFIVGGMILGLLGII